MTKQPAQKRGQGRSKREAAQLATRRAEIFTRWLRGETQAAIGRSLAMSPQLVSLDVQAALAEWREQNRGSIAEAAEYELRRLHWVEVNAEIDYQRSRATDNGELQPGDPRFLKLIIECGQERRKLGGIDQPARSEVKTTSDVNFRTFNTREEMREHVQSLVSAFRERSNAPN